MNMKNVAWAIGLYVVGMAVLYNQDYKALPILLVAKGKWDARVDRTTGLRFGVKPTQPVKV